MHLSVFNSDASIVKKEWCEEKKEDIIFKEHLFFLKEEGTILTKKLSCFTKDASILKKNRS
ncbi:MAG: hypothetical protein D3916_07640 [Candidatus Electrothrix sp. MAN1_4]|nr:hypothetical protein [Candidatus Electrothrix sp. MAN1_4]